MTIFHWTLKYNNIICDVSVVWKCKVPRPSTRGRSIGVILPPKRISISRPGHWWRGGWSYCRWWTNDWWRDLLMHAYNTTIHADDVERYMYIILTPDRKSLHLGACLFYYMLQKNVTKSYVIMTMKIYQVHGRIRIQWPSIIILSTCRFGFIDVFEQSYTTAVFYIIYYTSKPLVKIWQNSSIHGHDDLFLKDKIFFFSKLQPSGAV